jgi:putative pyruvate formate lyase activating enzyme
MLNYEEYSHCRLCAHGCGIDRLNGEIGICRSSSEISVARAALHFWEEPPISGEGGSGAIFFSGCSLGCVYCQNREISRGESGKRISVTRLVEIMFELKEKGAHNINLVTPTHFAPSIRAALKMAKANNLNLPIVYNTSSYDTPKTIRSFDGLVDIYLPDFKYYLSKTAAKLSHAENYPEAAKLAIAEMMRQHPKPVLEDGLMRSGVIARILLLPAHLAEAKLCMKYLYDSYGDSIYLSLMNQYTPAQGMTPPLNRRVTRGEYREMLDYAEKLGIKNGFTQDFGTASESFIPKFDNTGV